MEVDYYDSPDIYEHIFLKGLQTLEKRYSSDYDRAILLHELLACADHYLGNLSVSLDREHILEIHDLFTRLRHDLVSDVFGKKIANRDNSLAIGQVIDALCFFGLPRIQAIKATSKWLNIGESTARTHNEFYRGMFTLDARKNHFKTKYFLSFGHGIIAKHLKENSNFPIEHPKAKKAFTALKQLFLEEHPKIRRRIIESGK